MFERIVCVNRGEAAVRLIATAAELRGAGEAPRVIALHTAAERSAKHVRLADETFEIGGSAEATPGVNPYLDYGELERAIVATQADAVWVGWGFVAEHPDFADLCDRLGVTFIGPPGDVMRLLGDKIGSKLLAEQHGVPVAPWSGGPLESYEQALEMGDRIGYPLMVKATSGGGGRGIRKVEGPEAMAEAIDRAQREALGAFGDPTLFLEKVVADARHIEVQVAADNHGNVWALGVRDCSMQRRNQKIIEESRSPMLSRMQEGELSAAAVRLVGAAGYRGVGTVEFLYEPPEGRFAFLEVNTRLQVEHPVTEQTTGVDLVRLQLQIAAGWELQGDSPQPFGHSIEARLNAEDADRGFAPAPGRIEVLQFAGGPGIRVDSGYAEGDTVPSDYDSMVAKIIATGADRDEAARRLRRALAQTTVVIDGGTTNKAFLVGLLDRPEFSDGGYHTSWLDSLLGAGTSLAADHGEAAVLAAVTAKFDELERASRDDFLASAARGRPNLVAPAEHLIDLGYRGQRYRAAVSRITPRRYLVTIDGAAVAVDVDRLTAVESRMVVGDTTWRVVTAASDAQFRIEIDGLDHVVTLDDGGLLRSPSPALVVSVLAEPGTVVERGTPLVILEAMKVETALVAPVDGVITEVLVSPNTQVDAGAVLVRMEEVDDSEPDTDQPGATLDFDSLGITWAQSDQTAHLLAMIDEMRWNVLGFARPAEAVSELLAHYREQRAGLATVSPDVLRAEVGVLNAFADLASLSRNRPADEVESPETHSPQEYFHRYLRALDAEAEGLSEAFQTRLDRALGHFGVTLSSPLDDLAKAAFGIAATQTRSRDVLPVVRVVMDAVGSDPTTLPAEVAPALRSALDDVVAATQLRHPAVGVAARSRRQSLFETPQLAAARRDALQRSTLQLDELARAENPNDRRDLLSALVASPYRLAPLLSDRGPDGQFADRFALAEVITRRNYMIRNLESLDHYRVGDVRLLQGTWSENTAEAAPGSAERWNVLVAVCDRRDLGSAVVALRDAAISTSLVEAVVLDLYVRSDEQITHVDRLVGELRAAINASPFPPNVRRATVSVVDEAGRVEHITFRPEVPGDGLEATVQSSLTASMRTSLPEVRFVEDPIIRGLHPMIAERLQIGRFSDFDLTRLPSPEDTWLFQAAGRDNERDVRLFAAAEVRDMTPVRDSDGRVVALPELERVLKATLDGLGAARARFPRREQPSWNRVLLYVWPVVDVPFEDFEGIATRLAPLTIDLGLEMVTVQARVRTEGDDWQEIVVRFSADAGQGMALEVESVPTGPLKPLDDYAQNVLRSRLRGAPYPYEVVRMLSASGGRFVEYDLVEDDEGPVFHPVDRDPGQNVAGVVVGVVSAATQRYPEGIQRVAILGDPTRSLGSIAEAECARIMAALDLAEVLGAPVEWFALSSGARIAMDSGTENMDWISRVLRRIVEFTQGGGEINVIVTGINVGAQPYWNAEATMLMHTRGILVMTPDSAMVLTGKQALDFSGGVSAEDNFGIGGFDRIMGPNGQAQYWAPDLRGAVDILHLHYQHSYVAPGERFPRRTESTDPVQRDVCSHPHDVPGLDFTTVGDIFSDEANPGRKKPFDIRSLMEAVADQDHPTLERWAPMRDAESVVVLDAHLGGYPVALLGVESRPMPRRGQLPADGPDQWTAGTLFPMSSKKMARALNAASGTRPAVVLANLSGFDGSPESLSRLQLEFGAEIGRAVVNFDGPIVFCVVSRFHGGAFVVFSGALNDNMQVLAVEGTYASVLGGAPAAAVVFAGEVRRRVEADERVALLRSAVDLADPSERAQMVEELSSMRETAQSEIRGEVAAEFDRVHSIERAQAVGSVHRIIAATALRPELIEAVERGMATAIASSAAAEESTAVEQSASSSGAAPTAAHGGTGELGQALIPESPVMGDSTILRRGVEADAIITLPDALLPDPSAVDTSPEATAVASGGADDRIDSRSSVDSDPASATAGAFSLAVTREPELAVFNEPQDTVDDAMLIPGLRKFATAPETPQENAPDPVDAAPDPPVEPVRQSNDPFDGWGRS